MARRPDTRQLSLVPLLDAAGPHVPEPPHWRDVWTEGDPVPAGWFPPRRGCAKPGRPGLCDQPFDRAVASEILRFLREEWCPDVDVPLPFTAVLETMRRDDRVEAHLEAFDGGLAWFRLVGRPGAWVQGRWQYIAGASADECQSGLAWSVSLREWSRLPSRTVWDAASECFVRRPMAEAA